MPNRKNRDTAAMMRRTTSAQDRSKTRMTSSACEAWFGGGMNQRAEGANQPARRKAPRHRADAENVIEGTKLTTRRAPAGHGQVRCAMRTRMKGRATRMAAVSAKRKRRR